MTADASSPPLRPRFWEHVPLDEMTPAEWESLCDGCGKCCLNKLEYEDTGEIVFTRIACRLLDRTTCRCTDYRNRRAHVPDCVHLSPGMLGGVTRWLPRTCAYRLLHEGKALKSWHPLVSGDPISVHTAGVSVQGWTVSETDVDEDDWDHHLIDEQP
ncbi:MAG: YcgN family cysteine cluster protein [Gemmobacter sp.]